jgi:hypothetical protein
MQSQSAGKAEATIDSAIAPRTSPYWKRVQNLKRVDYSTDKQTEADALCHKKLNISFFSYTRDEPKAHCLATRLSRQALAA